MEGEMRGLGCLCREILLDGICVEEYLCRCAEVYMCLGLLFFSLQERFFISTCVFLVLDLEYGDSRVWSK